MAGIGVKLNHIYGKNTLTTNLAGMAYSTIVTIAPMIVVIAALIVMQKLLGFSGAVYARRELFACTILYIFIFSLLTASPFNSVLSRYLSDVIYNETYEDILPCYYLGMGLNIAVSAVPGLIFCIHEYVVGKVDILYVFTGYCGYMALVLVFYSMLYLSICKDYKKISYFFLLGMLTAILISVIVVRILDVECTFGMLLGMVLGFVLIAALECSAVKSYFKKNSGNYQYVLQYFRRYWQLIVTNFLYTLGMYIHNFVFWTTDLHMVVAKSFVCVTSYDMATCIAMFTNISSSVIFIARVEMHWRQGDGYRTDTEENVPPAGRGTDEPDAYPVYYLTGTVFYLYHIPSAVRIWWSDYEDLSVSGSRIFYHVPSICGDHFPVLFQ